MLKRGDPDGEDSSSTVGALHRTWINIEGAVTNRDRHVILAEAERGEDSTVAAYKDAMQKELSAPIKDIVKRQSTEVKAAHDKIRSARINRVEVTFTQREPKSEPAERRARNQ